MSESMLEAMPHSKCLSGRLSDYLELTKPRLTGLVLLTTAAGFWLGARADQDMRRLIPSLVGMALLVGGANALNQWMERAEDALMRRTRHRPLPSGRLEPDPARRFGVCLVISGLACLMLSAGALSTALGALASGSYLFVYTPLKRRTAICTLVGAVPGALPPVIGWAAAHQSVGPEAWALFAILFVWQLPHFLAIALLHREDYARARFQMLASAEPFGMAAARQIGLYSLALLPVSLYPAVIGLGGRLYFFTALALGFAFVGIATRAAADRSLPSCRALFLASLLYLPALLGVLICDQVPR